MPKMGRSADSDDIQGSIQTDLSISSPDTFCAGNFKAAEYTRTNIIVQQKPRQRRVRVRCFCCLAVSGTNISSLRDKTQKSCTSTWSMLHRDPQLSLAIATSSAWWICTSCHKVDRHEGYNANPSKRAARDEIDDARSAVCSFTLGYQV